jgi:ABC-type antimicrobial peptide transport system permease subunit
MQADVLRGERRLRADYAPVDAGFREVYDLGLRSGRWFSADEIAEQKPVAVIDPVLAQTLFGEVNPVGLSILREAGPQSQELQVIGVSERVILARHLGSDPPALFVPAAVSSRGEFGLALRLRGTPQDFAPRLQTIAHGIDADIALTDVDPFASLRAKELGWTRLVVGLFAPLGLLALVLAGTGLTALLGSLVAQRVREIGLRRALGARAPSLVRALLGRISIWGCGGVLFGSALAFVLMRPLGETVYGRSPVDWFSVAGTILVMGLALALAVALPLRRALRIEPTEALRED